MMILVKNHDRSLNKVIIVNLREKLSSSIHRLCTYNFQAVPQGFHWLHHRYRL